MHDALNYANIGIDFFKAGFAQVNWILGIIIAVYWAWRMPDWSAILTTAIGAVIMHIVAIVLAPVVDHNGPLHLPPYQDATFWRFVAALFLGYTVAVGILFLLKSLVLNRGSRDAGTAGSLMMAGAAAAQEPAGHHEEGHGGHGQSGHEDHGHGGGHDDHGHGGGHDSHDGHDDHGHGGGHDNHGGHDDHGPGGGHDSHGHHDDHGHGDSHHGHH